MTTIVEPLRTRPQNAAYDIDVGHSSAEFAVKHLMIATVKGKVPIVRGTVAVVDGAPTIEAELDIARIDTGVEARDAHLRSADFFDATAHPTLRFSSTRLVEVRPDTFRVEGELTIRGVTRPVEIEAEHEGGVRDPWGKQRVAVTARTTIDRREWGLTWNQALEAGGIMVGDKVKIELNLSLVERA